MKEYSTCLLAWFVRLMYNAPNANEKRKALSPPQREQTQADHPFMQPRQCALPSLFLAFRSSPSLASCPTSRTSRISCICCSLACGETCRLPEDVQLECVPHISPFFCKLINFFDFFNLLVSMCWPMLIKRYFRTFVVPSRLQLPQRPSYSVFSPFSCPDML